MHPDLPTEHQEAAAGGAGQMPQTAGPQLAARYLGSDPDVHDVLARFDFVVTEWIEVGPSPSDGSHTHQSLGGDRACDVVVIDGQSDDRQPLSVLKAVRAEGRDLPVIFVVSPDNSQTATAGLDLGADDVIPKTAVFERRLGAALRRVLDRVVVARRQAERKAREGRLRQVVDNAPDGISIVAADGELLAMNAAAARSCGGVPGAAGGIDVFALVAGGARAPQAMDAPAPDLDLVLVPVDSVDDGQAAAASVRREWMEQRVTLERDLAGARRSLEAAEVLRSEERAIVATECALWDEARRAFEVEQARLLALAAMAASETRESEAQLSQERSRSDSDQTQWAGERVRWEEQKAGWDAERALWMDERAQWETERLRQQQERDGWQQAREAAADAARAQQPIAPAGEAPRRGLEAVGALATAIAPDLERLLVGLRGPGPSSRVSESSLDGDQLYGRWALAEAAINQAAVLARQLAIFSRRQTGTSGVIDLQASVREAEPLLSRLAGSHSCLTLRGGTDPICVAATTDDFEQLLTSLVVFGRDILPIGGSLLLEIQPAAAEAGSRSVTAGPVLSLSASAYGIQRPSDTSVITQLAERCGGELSVGGDAERSVQVDVVFRAPAGVTPAVSAWRGTAVA